jgi:iron-sulfur cluster repair protein YtfE (RIC family)
MSTLTGAIRKHHLSLAKTSQEHARGVGDGQSQTEHDAFVAFLRRDLLPHATGEELHLYPLVETLLRNHGSPTATMAIDHEFIAGYISKIEQTTRDLAAGTSGERRRNLIRRLQELALRLDAILELHLAKEERVYLPLIEEYIDEARQRNVLEAIHDSYERGKHD